MTDYLVFKEPQPFSYSYVGRTDARSGDEAIKEVAGDTGPHWATPARSWNGLNIKGKRWVTDTESIEFTAGQEEPDQGEPEPPAEIKPQGLPDENEEGPDPEAPDPETEPEEAHV